MAALLDAAQEPSVGEERHSCLSNLPWWSLLLLPSSIPFLSRDTYDTCSHFCTASTHKATIFHSFLTSVISHLLEKLGKIHHLRFQTWIFHGFSLISEQMAAAGWPLMVSMKVIWNNHNASCDLLQFTFKSCKCFPPSDSLHLMK